MQTKLQRSRIIAKEKEKHKKNGSSLVISIGFAIFSILLMAWGIVETYNLYKINFIYSQKETCTIISEEKVSSGGTRKVWNFQYKIRYKYGDSTYTIYAPLIKTDKYNIGQSAIIYLNPINLTNVCLIDSKNDFAFIFLYLGSLISGSISYFLIPSAKEFIKRSILEDCINPTCFYINHLIFIKIMTTIKF